MSDELYWSFTNKDDAKAEIRAAVDYLLRDATCVARADLLTEIIQIVCDLANGLPPGPPDPWTICRVANGRNSPCMKAYCVSYRTLSEPNHGVSLEHHESILRPGYRARLC